MRFVNTLTLAQTIINKNMSSQIANQSALIARQHVRCINDDDIVAIADLPVLRNIVPDKRATRASSRLRHSFTSSSLNVRRS